MHDLKWHVRCICIIDLLSFCFKSSLWTFGAWARSYLYIIYLYYTYAKRVMDELPTLCMKKWHAWIHWWHSLFSNHSISHARNADRHWEYTWKGPTWTYRPDVIFQRCDASWQWSLRPSSSCNTVGLPAKNSSKHVRAGESSAGNGTDKASLQWPSRTNCWKPHDTPCMHVAIQHMQQAAVFGHRNPWWPPWWPGRPSTPSATWCTKMCKFVHSSSDHEKRNKKWTPKAKPWAHMRMLLAVQRFQKVRHPKDHIPACRFRQHFLRHRWIGSIRGEHPQCEELLCSTVTHVSAAESNDNREFDVEKNCIYLYRYIYFVH